MFIRALLGMLLLCGGCVTVGVNRLKQDDFGRYRIPARIVLAGIDTSGATKALVQGISGSFIAAGFTVVNPDYVDGMLSAYGFSLRDLVNGGRFSALRDIAGIDGIVLLREFYGAELHVVDTASGNEIASGCWRTGYINIVNDIIDQLKKKKAARGLCPVKLE